MVEVRFRGARPSSTRRGWSLISLIGALAVGAMVLGVCVPFYLASHRLVERNAGQARARELARELTSRFREDVRRARSVSVASGGTGLNLEAAGSRSSGLRVRYAWSTTGLVREVWSGTGARRERMVYAEPLREVRFQRDGASVVAVLEFSAPTGLPGKPWHIEAMATPRIEP